MFLQDIVYPLAELAQAEDVAALRGDVQQQLQPSRLAAESDATALAEAAAGAAGEEAAAATEDGGAGAGVEPEQAHVSSDPAAVLRGVQQQLVHLTMLLCSRNLWMRPAVLEAPAQDPQYLEAIHKVGSCTCCSSIVGRHLRCVLWQT